MTCPISSVVLGFLLCLLCVLNDQGISITVAAAKTNSRVHIVYLGERQHDNPKLITDSHHDLLATIVGSKSLASELMVYSYRHGFSGFAAKLTEAQAQKCAELPDVVRVIPNTLYKLQTTRSWDFLGLSPQSPSSNILPSSDMGDGVIIGVLDSGIWPESKSFNEEGLGPVPSHWKGICESGEKFNATLHCNRKIIGARWFNDGILAEYGQPLNTSERTEFMSPRDAHGHGTHTASTAAGSFVTNVSYKGLGHGTVRGGAPNARLAIYKVCWNVLVSPCSGADILKAFDEAIHDGVDVLSLSIGGSVPLYSDVDERDVIATGSFHAVARGITVVCAASNDGPSAQTVQNTSPWIITVAASTTDRAFPTSITLGNNKTFLGQAMFTGLEIGFTSLIYPESGGLEPTATGVCESLSLNKTMVSGKVVLCFTSLGWRAVPSASAAVKEAGGVGLIVAKNPTNGLYPCSDDFPCIEVDYEIGTRIVFYIRSTRYPLVKLNRSKTIAGKPILAKVADFSSRGPNSAAPAILKPDIAAPGVNILAATSPLHSFVDAGYVMLSGTSMATPHVSGIVALLKALHPNWSPAAIRSALVTSAWRNGPSGLPIFAEGSPQKLTNPFDFGGGIVHPNAAANPGLVYDMGAADYIHYLCAMGYKNSAISRLTGQATTCPIMRPSILDINLPSITIPSLRHPITVTRTVTNVGDPKSVYEATIDPPLGTVVSVKPNPLVFNSTVQKLTFEITISTTHQMNTGYYFGSLTWTDRVHAVRIPLSVRTEFLQHFADYH
ncbi:putative tripeptidyl-peptidase II [Rosa chinensis]|uniref:Putative tripeptidyl-peptidase II n=3 Tax=Rosa chinensis TaxID=74649 RepID=A0A2P6QQ19_ROSCH|nr:subtilisin-like protease SBT3.9 isoform X1 [Rosa chinensis]PRQ36280.1 putative tripeptidyl-peptidase II [Rosa chinensis]